MWEQKSPTPEYEFDVMSNCALFAFWETIKMGTVELQSLSQEHVALVQIVQDANALTLITTDFYFHDYDRKYNIMCKNVIKC